MAILASRRLRSPTFGTGVPRKDFGGAGYPRFAAAWRAAAHPDSRSVTPLPKRHWFPLNATFFESRSYGGTHRPITAPAGWTREVLQVPDGQLRSATAAPAYVAPGPTTLSLRVGENRQARRRPPKRS
jgi:hypothetical protein